MALSLSLPQLGLSLAAGSLTTLSPCVFPLQADHEAERDQVVAQVIEEASAEAVIGHRPAGGVNHKARLGFGGVDLPQFLEAECEALRILALGELEPLDQLAARVATRTFGEHGVAAMQFHAELEAAGRLPILAQALVAGGHALDTALLVEQHSAAAKPGKISTPRLSACSASHFTT
jgi:hypothetical protein